MGEGEEEVVIPCNLHSVSLGSLNPLTKGYSSSKGLSLYRRFVQVLVASQSSAFRPWRGKGSLALVATWHCSIPGRSP